MFRRERRCLAIVLAVAALALPAAPAAAAGRSEEGAAWTIGMDLWARLGEIGGWLRAMLMSDGTSFIDPNGGTSYIDPNGLQGSSSEASPFIDPNG